MNKIKVAPQKGKQEEFFFSKADFLIYGGSAGSGKSYALLLEPLRHIKRSGFGAVIFRRNSTQVRNQGGLWDTSMEVYPMFEGSPKETTLEWNFSSGANIKFAHLEYDSTVLSWQGSQICLLGFDELTHFSKKQVFYMLSRNRSTCGVNPYIRATTNPDSQSWVREFIDWWIDPDSGLAIPDRSGVIRYFIQLNDEIYWADTKEELQEKFEGCLPKSFTFISASIYDNQKLLDINPEYLANLQALSKVERERLLNGNWNIKPSAGLYFQKGYFEVVEAVPANKTAVRYWDRAATKKTESNDPDYTVGIKLEKDSNNIIYITDMVRMQDGPLGVQNIIKNTAIRDGISVRIGIEEDPGQAGIVEADYLARQLQGFNVKRNRVSKDKVTRSLPVSAQSEAGNIKVLRAKWNDDLFKELENFPEGSHDDCVDALSGAFNMINQSAYSLSSLSR